LGRSSPWKAGRSFTLLPPDIKQLRDDFGLTQEQFAVLLGISVRTLRNRFFLKTEFLNTQTDR
jgi:hypothetical protein